MENHFTNKGGWLARFLLGTFLLCLMAISAEAKIEILPPTVGPLANQISIERGANIKVTIRFTNDELGSDALVSSVKLFLKYNTDYLDSLPADDGQLLAPYDKNLPEKVIPKACAESGWIKYSCLKGTGGVGITVAKGNSVDLLTITFHVKKADSAVDSTWLVAWDTDKANNVQLLDFNSGQLNIAKTAPDPTSVHLAASTPPSQFTGINSVNDPGTGNKLLLDWTNSSNGSSDLNDGAATYYTTGLPDKKALRYNVYLAKTKDFEPGAGNKLSGAQGLAVTTLPDTTVSDVIQPYYYVVRAQDDVQPTPNEESNKINQADDLASTVSHDITPPDYNPSTTIAITSLNKGATFTLPVPTVAKDDYESYLILRKDFVTDPGPAGVTPPALKGANPAAPDGTDYIHGDDYFPFIGKMLPQSDGWIIAAIKNKSDLPFQEEGNLNNSKTYYYAVYAFDHASKPDESPFQQGRNYSTKPAIGKVQPGMPPDNVEDIRALADPDTGIITVRWLNPVLTADGSQIDPAKAENYGGTRLVYTDLYDDWKNLAVETPEDANHFVKDVDVIDPPIKDIKDKETIYPISSLPTTKTYYFKAFSYNIADKPARKYNVGGVKVAAMPQKGGVPLAETIQSYTLEGAVVKKFGITTLAISFDISKGDINFLKADDSVVTTFTKDNKFTVKSLIDAINKIDAGTTGRVTAFAYYSPAGFVGLKKIGYTNDTKNIDNATSIAIGKSVGDLLGDKELIIIDQPYQVTLNSGTNITFKLKGFKQK